MRQRLSRRPVSVQAAIASLIILSGCAATTTLAGEPAQTLQAVAPASITRAEPEGFTPDPRNWIWPDVASNKAFQAKVIDARYSVDELRHIWIALNFLPGRRPAGARPQGQTSAGPAPAASAPPAGRDPAGEAAPTIQSTGMRMPPFMAANSAPNMISHGRGFRGLEIPYGGNGYTNNGIIERTNFVDDLIASGDLVFVTWLIEGVHANPMFGFPGSGKRVSVRESALFRFENGKVVETDFRGDDFALYTGLGGTVAFPVKPSAPAAQAPMQAGGDKAPLILAEAAAASSIDPSRWEWPPAADEPNVKAAILGAKLTAEEKRNAFAVLAMQSGRRWPVPGTKAAAAYDAMKATPADPEKARAVARNNNLLGAASLFAPNSVSKGRGFRGLEEHYGANGYLPDSLTDRVNRLDGLIAHGDRVWFSWIIDAAHTGRLFGFQGTGKRISVRESAWVRFRDGQIVESDYYGDDLALYLQAGGSVSFPDGGAKPVQGQTQ